MARKTTKQIGNKAEDKAEKFLKKNGYNIIARNWRSRFGEVDIIATDKDVLVFIEVKAKSGNRFGTPGEMITKNKLQKIIRTAQIFIDESDYKGQWRIDAVLSEGIKQELIKNITL